MLNQNIAPFFLQIFRDQPAMTEMGFFFAAKETTTLKNLSWSRIFYVTAFHERDKFLLVNVPVSSVLLVSVKNILGGSKRRHVNIVSAAYRFCKITEIILLREAGELRNIIQSYIYKTLYPSLLQPSKECLGRFLRKTDCKNLHPASLLLFGSSSSLRV